MEVLFLVAVWVVPLLVGWLVIYSAMLAALRRHARD
jgi:hypothetical protein